MSHSPYSSHALTIFVGCLLLFCACDQNLPEASRSATTRLEQQVAELERQEAGRLARASFADSNNAFALDLYQQLRKDNGNLFLSPYSISSAIAMTYAGARGRTEQQIAKALHFSLPQEKLHLAFGELQSQLNALSTPWLPPVAWTNPVQLSVANSLWPAKSLSLRKNYLQLIEKNYGGCVTPLDYAQADAARQTINNWVEQRTQNKIKDLVPPGVIDPSTVLVLANTIYFKGAWLTPFKPENTRDMPFYISSTQTVSTPMMHEPNSGRLKCRYYQNEEVQLLDLPYKGDNLSMLVLLPRKADGLEALECGLTSEKFKVWVSLLRADSVEIWFPRFKVTSQFRLDEKLKALGMVDAFGAADFTGMFDQRGPAISAVLHKAFVDVNEEGTEAAAGTGVLVLTSLRPPFRADHPFLYFIRERRTGAILFLGRVVNPQSGSG